MFSKCSFLTSIFNDLLIQSDDMSMKGFTATELAEALGLKLKTVKKRLETAEIKPLTKEAVYPESALEAIRNVRGRGKPPKAKADKDK